jgi:CDGSH iron-sulfur domain-containing protein 3
MVEGILELFDENDRPIAHSGRLSLCRCGATRNPPFCDGAHRGAGWTSKKKEGA